MPQSTMLGLQHVLWLLILSLSDYMPIANTVVTWSKQQSKQFSSVCFRLSLLTLTLLLLQMTACENESNKHIIIIILRASHPAYKKNWVMVCWCWWLDWCFAYLTAPVVTTPPSIILSSNKIQNGDILVPSNSCPPEKWPLKWREINNKIIRVFMLSQLMLLQQNITLLCEVTTAK